MKQLTILVALFCTVEAHTTHWLTYFVYVETEYLQGPWVRTGGLYSSDFRYLAAHVHEDLFGTLKEDLAFKMLERLGEVKPELYDWEYGLQLNGDTACLEPYGTFELSETILNEVTATLVLNGFAAVRFTYAGTTDTYTLTDLTIPYFDLVQPVGGPMDPDGNQLSTDGEAETMEGESGAMGKDDRSENNPLAVWLFISVVLNIALVITLILKPRR